MPLLLSECEWCRLSRSRCAGAGGIGESADRRERLRRLDAASREMTTSWPNSVENVNKRNEELRRARLEVAEQANAKFYKKYVRNQQLQQRRLMHSARDVLFKNKDAPKLFLGAVIESVTQKEREEQVKFINERRREVAVEKKDNDNDITRKAKEWHELQQGKKKLRFQANKQHQKEILEQAQEISDRSRIEYETEMNQQKIDNTKASEEMAAIKKFDDDYKAAEKARIWRDMEQSRQEAEKRRNVQNARDNMDDRLLNVLLQSRARIENKRKKTERDLKEEKLRVLEQISQKLESGDAARDLKEQNMLDKAIAEKNAVAEKHRLAELDKKANIRAQRQQARKDFLKNEERKLHEEHTMQQWDLMNRFKNDEIYKEYQDQKRKEKAKKTKEYREDILQLWKEREDRENQQKAETRYFYGDLAERKLRDEDNRLLTHADGLLEEARRNGRPDLAIRKAIRLYCKLYNLYPGRELPASLREHFMYRPTDLSRPNPHYVHVDSVPDEPDDMGETTEDQKRDGLQPFTKVPPTKSNKLEEVKSHQDYKRSGPSNGLQQKHNGQAETTLPPLQVGCHTDECKCEHKSRK